MTARAQHRIPEAWPALLSREQAAAYAGVSEKVLVRVCPVSAVDLGAQRVLYRRTDLDAWIEGLPVRLPRGGPESHDEADRPALDDGPAGRLADALARAQRRTVVRNAPCNGSSTSSAR